MEVEGPDGEIILDEKGLLGDNGHLDLEDNTAESPLGYFYTTTDLASGIYVMKVTLYDLVGKGKVK